MLDPSPPPNSSLVQDLSGRLRETKPNMKFLFTATIATLASFVAATPTQVVKRASPEDKCDIGYASINGG